MNKPTSIKVVQALIIIKLVMVLLVLSVIILSLVLNNDVGRGMRSGLHIVATDSYHVSEYISQFVGIPLILIILSLVFVNERKYKAIIVIFIIQILSTISSSIFATLIALIQLFIVIFNSNAKNYFKPKNSDLNL